MSFDINIKSFEEFSKTFDKEREHDPTNSFHLQNLSEFLHRDIESFQIILSIYRLSYNVNNETIEFYHLIKEINGFSYLLVFRSLAEQMINLYMELTKDKKDHRFNRFIIKNKKFNDLVTNIYKNEFTSTSYEVKKVEKIYQIINSNAPFYFNDFSDFLDSIVDLMLTFEKPNDDIR